MSGARVNPIDLAKRFEAEILHGSMIDPEVWVTAVQSGVHSDLFACQQARKLYLGLERWYASHADPPEPGSLLQLGLSQDELEWPALHCPIPCGPRGARQIVGSLEIEAAKRHRVETMRRAQAALARDDAEEAQALLEHLARDRSKDTAKRRPGISPAQVVANWQQQGPLARIPTGIEPLDRLCRGGFPRQWRVQIIGAPSAGKTALEMVIASHMARGAAQSGVCVGIVAVDEEPEDLTVRLCQIAGFTVAEAEAREPQVLTAMAEALEALPIRLYDFSWTIESAAKDLADWATESGSRGALFVDSVQTARSDAAERAKGPRELVEGNVKAMREACSQGRLLTVGTSEANRASYRNRASKDEQDDLAAGAESRAIEFSAQTLMVLRTPKGHPDVIHVHVAKNRRAHKGEFWLRLDREHHTLVECDDPTGTDSEADQDRDDRARHGKAQRAESDARELARVVLGNPGLGTRDLRSLAEAELGIGHGRYEVAAARLKRGIGGMRLTNSGTERRCKWVVIEAPEGAQCD